MEVSILRRSCGSFSK